MATHHYSAFVDVQDSGYHKLLPNASLRPRSMPQLPLRMCCIKLLFFDITLLIQSISVGLFI